jgi:hypothetical protein
MMPDNDRLLYIHSVLVQEGLLTNANDKAKVVAETLAPFNYNYEFIDYIILKSSCFSVLEKRYGLVDFEEILHRAIPTLYFAYSRANFVKAPDKWKAEASFFINHHMNYFYDYGEEKFRNRIDYYINNSIPSVDVMIFNFFSENDNRAALAKGGQDVPKFYKYFNTLMWNFDYNLSEFCKLSYDEQAELFTDLMKVNLAFETDNETVFQIPESVTNEIEEYWKLNAEAILNSPAIVKLDHNKNMSRCIPTIILEFQKAFKKRKK